MDKVEEVKQNALQEIEQANDVATLEAIKVNSYFYNTGIFEPYCICHLLIIDSKNILENSVETKETDYFLVGGFEKRRKQGMIKLYKIIYDEKK